MNVPVSRKRARLPKQFPVGTTYVVEGRGGEDGRLRVYSRYLVLPSGERINLGGDSARPAVARADRRTRNHSAGHPAKRRVAAGSGDRSERTKKIMATSGTSRQHRR